MDTSSGLGTPTRQISTGCCLNGSASVSSFKFIIALLKNTSLYSDEAEKAVSTLRQRSDAQSNKRSEKYGSTSHRDHELSLLRQGTVQDQSKRAPESSRGRKQSRRLLSTDERHVVLRDRSITLLIHRLARTTTGSTGSEEGGSPGEEQARRPPLAQLLRDLQHHLL